MRTAIIKIVNAERGDYPIRLHFDGQQGDGQQGDWLAPENAVATADIARDLSLPDPPRAPGGKPLRGDSLGQFYAAQDDVSDLLAPIGQYLHRLLFGGKDGEIGRAWRRLLEEHGSTHGEGLRTILDVEPDALKGQPWELLSDGEDMLFLDSSNPFIRGTVGDRPLATKLEWPLRALIVVGDMDEQIRAEEEVEAIKYALRKISKTIDLEILLLPSRDEIFAAYKEQQPHIFHFVGHSTQVASGEPALVVLKDGKPWDWTVPQIRNGLKYSGWAARFAFINACRTNDPVRPKGTWTIAEAFVDAGIPAVLTMTGDILGDAAEKLAGALYTALATRRPLDSALAAARLDLYVDPRFGDRRREWALPSLYLSVDADEVLNIQLDITEDLRRQIETDPVFTEIKNFIDWPKKRRQLWRGVDPYTQPGGGRNLLIVSGESSVGKSSLVKWCMEGCAMRGRELLWVSMKDNKAKDFVHVMRLIQVGDETRTSLICRPLTRLNEDAFNLFNWRLMYYLNNNSWPPPGMEMPPGQHVIPKDARWRGGEGIEQAFVFFREALAKAAGNTPLIIALDQLDIEDTHFNYLALYLFSHVATGCVRNVRIILVLSEGDERGNYKKGMQILGGSFERVELQKIKGKFLEPYAREFLRYNDIRLKEGKTKTVFDAFVSSNSNDDWKPEVLGDILGIVKNMIASSRD